MVPVLTTEFLTSEGLFINGLTDGWLVECGKEPIFFSVLCAVGDVGPPIGTNNHEVRDPSPSPHLKNYRMAEEESRDIILFLKNHFTT